MGRKSIVKNCASSFFPITDIMSDEEYEVEKILDKRAEKGGYTEYLVKWRNYEEPVDNLGDAEKAIKAFEKDLEAKNITMNAKNHKRKSGPNSAVQNPAKLQKIETKERAKGFSRGLAAEKIIGIRKEPEKIFFLIKWKGTEETDFVNAKEAKLKIPQVVIEFYEEKLNWFKDDAEESQDGE